MKVPEALILVLGFLSIFSGNGHPSSLEELKSLPYLAWSNKPDTKPSGVIKYDKNKSFDGYNFFSSDFTGKAYLMDMAGHIVHRWKLPNTGGEWQFVKLLKDGSIISSSGCGIVKLDKNSKLIWEKPVPANHDIEVLPDGTFLILSWGPSIRFNGRAVFFDSIDHLSIDGKTLDKWSTYGHFKELHKLHFPSLLDSHERKNIKKMGFLRINYNLDYMNFKGDESSLRKYREQYIYYHLNSIQALPGTILGLKDKRFQKGNWLICFRNVDLICILDKDTHKVVWSWGPGILDGPHMPRMLNNGDILVFDNGYHRSYSRLIMIDPESDKIVWEYKANPPENFSSKFGGSSQFLLNGNILVCETEKGRAFEMTPRGETVWEFLNPEVDKKGRRKTIYRMVRVSRQEVAGWLKEEELIDKIAMNR